MMKSIKALIMLIRVVAPEYERNFFTNVTSILLAALTCSCAHFSSLPPGHEGDWLESLNSKWEIHSPNKPHSLNRLTFMGRTAIRFEIRQGEAWEKQGQHSFRSEIATNEFPPMGTDRWYRFSIFLPENFPIEENRLVLAQWWPKTKKELGEVSRSPILQLRFIDGSLGVLMRRYPDRVVRDDDNYIQTKLFSSKKFSLGIWHDFVFHAKWSAASSGSIKAWWNGNRIIDYIGPTENQDAVGPMFKFGLYRDDSPSAYVAYFSDVGLGESAQEIGIDLSSDMND